MVVSRVSGMVDSHASIYRAAQRDVYLRIAGFLNISEEQLFQEIDNVEKIPATADR
jgi:hypothetical protein